MTDQPTAADLALDLQDCLRVSEEATPGPWETLDGLLGETFGVVTELFPIAPAITQAISSRRNANFIALTRTALPAACRRALAAEADLAKLLSVVGTYIDADAQVRGEAFRDLVGAYQALTRPELEKEQGWPTCWEREHQQRLAAEAEVQRLQNACSTQQHEISSILATALGYPSADETGDHTAESLAVEAARKLEGLRTDNRLLRDGLKELAERTGEEITRLREGT